MQVLKFHIAIQGAMLLTPVGRALLLGGLFQLLALLSFPIDKTQVNMVPALLSYWRLHERVDFVKLFK